MASGASGAIDYSFNSGPATSKAGSYSYVNKTVCFPAVPYAPAAPPVLLTFGASDWDGGARSILTIAGDGSYSFNVPVNVTGVLSGLSALERPRSLDAVDYAFQITPGSVNVVERGRVVAPVLGVNLATSPVFMVRRVGYRVEYVVDGVVVHTTAANDDRELFADAVLYSPIDYVDNPVLADVQVGEVSGIIRLITKIYEGNYAEVDGFVPLPRLYAGMTGTVSAGLRIPPSRGLAYNYDYAEAGGTVPLARLTAALRGPQVVVAHVAGILRAPVGASRLIVGNVMDVDSLIPSPKPLIADYEYAYAGGIWPTSGFQMGIWEDLLPPNRLAYPSALIPLDFITLNTNEIIVFHEAISLTDSYELKVSISIDMHDFVSVVSDMSFSAVLALYIQEKIQLATIANYQAGIPMEYSVDTQTGALSEYAGLGLKHYTRMADGSLWGISPQGICRVEEQGSIVPRAEVNLGSTDLGTMGIKRADATYLGLRTDGEVYLRIRVDGREYVYRARNTHDTDVYKIVLPRGERGRFWELNLELVDASYAELDSIEVEVGVSKRRITS